MEHRNPSHRTTRPIQPARLLLLALALLVFARPAFALPAQAAPATTYVVNTTAETADVNTADNICADSGGWCSLRAAVMQANAHAGADVITLPAGTYNLTMRLEPVDDLTINGAGKATTIIDGAGSGGAEGFRVRADVVFNNLTLRDFPRAIFIQSAESGHQVTVNNSALRDNLNIDTGYSGSAITNYCDTCSVSLNTVDVYNNASPACGAITSDGDLILAGETLVHGNEATSSIGGGICVKGGTLSVTQSRIYGNSTLTSGDSRFGGGIYQSGGSTSLFLAEVYGNSAQTGGGIYVDGGGFSAQNTQIYGNTAGGSGGGLLLASDSVAVIDSSIIRENQAYHAGGIFVWDSVEIRNSTIISNTASSLDNNSKGGAIYANDQTVTLVNTTISGNTAEYHGGGIYATNSAVVRMANVTLTNNSADANNDTNGLGGGFYQDSSSVIRAKNSIIAANKDLQSLAFEIWAPDCYGTLTSDGFNLLGMDNFLCTLAGDLSGMQSGQFSPGLDPKLGLLTFYAAEYYYHPVRFGPAVDRGNPAGCKDYANASLTADQIGQLRPYGSPSAIYTPRCDLGAVESSFKRFDIYLPLGVK